MTDRSPTADARDRGAVLPFLALSLVALLTLAGLVIDGGQAYAQRRQMQNAADAAAMAGARAVDRVRFAGAAATTVSAEVNQVATANGAESFTCEIINSAGTALGPCSSAAAVGNATAQGVRVVPTDRRDTSFGRIVGIDQLSADARAAATIQPIVGGRAQFAVCSAGAGGAYDLLGSNLKVDPVKAANLGEIVIVGSQVYKSDNTCAAKKSDGQGNASFKGVVDDQVPLVVGQPTEFSSDPGNNLPGGWEQAKVTCPQAPLTRDCLIVPIAYKVEGVGQNARIYVSDWAYFRVREGQTGNEQLLGRYVAPATAGAPPEGSETGTGPVVGSDLRTLRLIE